MQWRVSLAFCICSRKSAGECDSVISAIFVSTASECQGYAQVLRYEDAGSTARLSKVRKAQRTQLLEEAEKTRQHLRL